MSEDGTDRAGGACSLDWASVDAENCSIGYAVDVFGDRWSLLVLRELSLDVDRFDAIQTHLGISRRTLAERLGRLVDAGLVERIPYDTPGQRVRHRYGLTRAGAALGPVVAALREWGDAHRSDDREAPVRLVHTGCGHDARLHLRCTAGHDLEWNEAHGEIGPGALRIETADSPVGGDG